METSLVKVVSIVLVGNMTGICVNITKIPFLGVQFNTAYCDKETVETTIGLEDSYFTTLCSHICVCGRTQMAYNLHFYVGGYLMYSH